MHRARTFALISVLFAAFVGPAAAKGSAPKPVVLVFDASGSMWGQVGGEAKIAGARRVLGEVGDRLPEGTPLALVAYGHRREGDCADIETVLPAAPVDGAKLRAAVAALNPKGKTPITAALTQAFREAPSGATVILVTDGLETCGGDPCAQVRTARKKDTGLVLHVIGFDVAKEDVSSLECAAQAGGGLYLPAKDAGELAQALTAAVETPDGALVVRATRNGALQDVAVVVTPKGGGRDLGARTYATAATNPRTIPLADGAYSVRVRPVGIEGALERTDEIVVAGGGHVERAYDFSTGTISIGATRNGMLSDVTWQLFAPSDRRRAIASGRTYGSASSNPAKATVPTGEYELVLSSIEISGRPVVELGRMTVTPDAPAVRSHDFVSGDLAVEVVRGDRLVDATVAVRAGGRAVDQGRTYVAASSNPKRFTLEPGEYEVEIAEIRGAKATRRVMLAAGARQHLRVDLDAQR